MSLSGIFKNILLVICSVIIWHVTITPMQLLGYSITLCALVYYAFGHERIFEAYLALKDRSSDLAREMATMNNRAICSRNGLLAVMGIAIICVSGITLSTFKTMEAP